MLENIAFAVLFGGLVGMVAHIQKRGKIVKPRKTKKFIYLGFFEEVLTGSFASVLLVVSMGITTPLRLVFASLIGGFGGDAIIRGIELLRFLDRRDDQDGKPKRKTSE